MFWTPQQRSLLVISIGLLALFVLHVAYLLGAFSAAGSPSGIFFDLIIVLGILTGMGILLVNYDDSCCCCSPILDSATGTAASSTTKEELTQQ